MNLIKVSDLFEVKYGVNLELINLNESLQKSEDAVCFVSRTENNNGVSTFVEKIDNVKPISAGTLTVAGGGSVLATFLQPYEYYSGRDLFYLTPKRKMSEREMIYYSICIKRNKYRYSYNRQANKTLRDLFIPSKVPDKFLKLKIDELNTKSVSNKKISLSDRKWEWFKVSELFDLENGKSIIDNNLCLKGKTPVVSSTVENNGIVGFAENKADYQGENLTISIRGGGKCFYQKKPFCATLNALVLKPKGFCLTTFSGLFVANILSKEHYRYHYGRIRSMGKVKTEKIKLPADLKGNPDWQFMEDYIKSLPYSGSI